MSPPHISAAQTRANGWQVLPLPRGAKYPPPSGYTGKDGSSESVDVPVGHNYAIRLPDGVVALDVDHGYPARDTGRLKHGADSLAALIAKLGALPNTYTLSRREDRRSGQRFYRVPDGVVLIGEVPGDQGPDGQHSDIEVLQRHHRYAVGPGSTVDGLEYTLRGPGGAPMEAMPPPDVLPMLPKAWIRALSSTNVPRPVATARDAQGSVPVRRVTFDEASETYARAVLAFGEATAPGFNAKLFKFLAVSKAYWMAQGLTPEQWFNTAENEILAHPYYTTGVWPGIDASDVRVIGEVLSRSQIVWELVQPEPVHTGPVDDLDLTRPYIIDGPWDCGGPGLLAARAWLDLTRQKLHYWRGSFYRYSSGRWKPWEEGELCKILQHDIDLAFYYKPSPRGPVAVPYVPSVKNITEVRIQLQYVTARQDHWGLDKSVVFDNGVLDLTTRQLSPHTHEVFNLHRVNAQYEPTAQCPEWEAFIASSLPDQDQRDVLQEVMGYLISGRQDLHKIFGFWGEPRSGKSTITRVMEAILGKRSLTACRYASILGNFGLAAHADSSVIVVTEARTTKETKGAVDLFLAISGCDPVEVNVKNKQQRSVVLPGRLLMVSNTLPNVMDDSDAFASRFVHVLFLVSFLGREDHGLEGRLMGELPGIIAWSLRGLDRLTENGGRFTRSARGMAADRLLSVGSATMPTWFKDRVVVTGDPNDRIAVGTLHSNYSQWCGVNDIEEKYVSNAFQLGKWLATKLGEAAVVARVNGNVTRVRRGVKFVVPPPQEIPSYSSEPTGTLD